MSAPVDAVFSVEEGQYFCLGAYCTYYTCPNLEDLVEEIELGDLVGTDGDSPRVVYRRLNGKDNKVWSL